MGPVVLFLRLIFHVRLGKIALSKVGLYWGRRGNSLGKEAVCYFWILTDFTKPNMLIIARVNPSQMKSKVSKFNVKQIHITLKDNSD